MPAVQDVCRHPETTTKRSSHEANDTPTTTTTKGGVT